MAKVNTLISVEDACLTEVKPCIDTTLKAFNKALLKNPGLLREENIFLKWKPAPDPELTDVIQKAFLKAILLGMKHAARKTDFADDDPTLIHKADPLTFEEALEFAGNRVALTKEQFYKLSDEARMYAFTVGRLTQLDMVQKAQQTYLKMMGSEEGNSYEFVKQMLRDNPGLFDKGIGAYFDMVYRTNIQKDYMDGRALQWASDPPQFLEFIGIEDGRQTEICASCSGVILPYTDPWWDSHWPPLHFGCRSTLRAIYHEEAVARGLIPKEVINNAKAFMSKAKGAQAGFGGNPVKNNQTFTLSASQISRIGSSMIQDELNGVAGQTVCRDFSQPKEGYHYEKGLKNGAVRVPDEGLAPDELKNVPAARTLADEKGFYIEMKSTPAKGATQAGNSYFDAWINATEKLDFKILESTNASTISDHIYKAALQGHSVCLELSSADQVKPAAQALSSRSLALKGEGRSLNRAFVVYNGKVTELTWKQLISDGWEVLKENLTALSE